MGKNKYFWLDLARYMFYGIVIVGAISTFWSKTNIDMVLVISIVGMSYIAGNQMLIIKMLDRR